MFSEFGGLRFRGACFARVVVIACAVCVFLAPFSGFARSGSSDDRPKDRSELRATEGRDDRREERARDRAPRAKLRIRSRKPDDDGFRWVRLDARKSKANRGRLKGYAFSVRNLGTQRLLPGPGESARPVAWVRLPAKGRYQVEVKVRDRLGLTDSRKRNLSPHGKKEGAQPAVGSTRTVAWSLTDKRRPEDPQFYSRHSGPLGLGIIHALTGRITNRGVSGTLTALPNSGCGGIENNQGSNGIAVATGVANFGVSLAFPEAKLTSKVLGLGGATAGGLKIAGGNKSGACTQAKFDAINDQLAFQESQIQDLYATIDRDEEAFFFALSQLDTEIGSTVDGSFHTSTQRIADLMKNFMIRGAMWNPDSTKPWLEDGSPDVVASLDPLVLAACDTSSTPCCAGIIPADDATCEFAAVGAGPMVLLEQLSVSDDISIELPRVSGSAPFDSPCTYDCWKEVSAATFDESFLLQSYRRYAQHLFDAFTLCTAEDPRVRAQCPNRVQGSEEAWAPQADCTDDAPSTCSGTAPTPASNNVVPLFDQYNNALIAIYYRSIVALQQAYSIEQLANIYNYNRYVAGQCVHDQVDPALASDFCNSLVGQDFEGEKSISSFESVGGTRYSFDMLSGCNGARPQTPEEHAQAFECAQGQLALLFAQRSNLNWQALLGFILTDSPVAPQAYPTGRVDFPESPQLASFRQWNQEVEGTGIRPPIDYETLIGRSLPDFMLGARTPVDLFKRVAGEQTKTFYSSDLNSFDYTWTDDSVIYQAYQIGDAATCINTLLAYNRANNPDVTLDEVFTKYEDCPSIFAFHDGAPMNSGMFDGITVQPISFHEQIYVADCPAACYSCGDGQAVAPEAYQPGGQGLLDGTCHGYCSTGDNLCGDYRFATGAYEDCTACRAAAPNEATGSWAVSDCRTDTSILEVQNGIPSLQAACWRSPNGPYVTSGPVLCSSGLWGNNNGTLVCETGDDPLARLSAPMGGNVRLCESFDPATNASVGSDFDTDIACAGETFYGKKFKNSYGPAPIAPGSGELATYQDMLVGLDVEEPNYLSKKAGSDGTFDCAPDFFADELPATGGDPAPGFYKQCFCVEGPGLTWYRPERDLTTSAFASIGSSSTDADASSGTLNYTTLQTDLDYLACGNYRAGNNPEVSREYGTANFPDNNDLPPTAYISDQTTTNDNLWEEDIGVTGSADLIRQGLHYESAFFNMDLSCNSNDNIQLDVFGVRSGGGSGWEALVPKGVNGNDKTATSLTPYYGAGTVTYEFPKIQNRDNETSAHASFVYHTKSAWKNPEATGLREDRQGISIPMDVVLQCSEDGAEECVDQSKCMHLVTFRDGNWFGDDEAKRREVLSKRGYVCQTSRNRRDFAAGEGGVATANAYATMECELVDGRLFEFRLERVLETTPSSLSPDDTRASLGVTELH